MVVMKSREEEGGRMGGSEKRGASLFLFWLLLFAPIPHDGDRFKKEFLKSFPRVESE